jgi:exosortase
MADIAKSRSWWTPAIAIQIVILVVLVLFHYQHVVERLVRIWSTDGDWSHGFIIPLFSLYYLYMRRDQMPLGLRDQRAFSIPIGAILLSLAFLLYMQSTLSLVEYPKTLALILSLLGITLMVCGWPITRWSWFAIAFLVFAMPLPVRLYVQLTMPLRFIAAEVSAALLTASIPDMIAEGRGAIVEYMYQGEPGTLDIEQACSGIRLMMTMMALGVAMAFVSERPMWQRLIMVLSCVPIAIFCNIVRVTTTGFFVVLGHEELAHGFWHTLLGLGMLFVAFGLYGGISYVLSHLFVESAPEDEPVAPAPGGQVV